MHRGVAGDFNLDAGLLNRNMVMSDDVVFGSVNANSRHCELGAEALAKWTKTGWAGSSPDGFRSAIGAVDTLVSPTT